MFMPGHHSSESSLSSPRVSRYSLKSDSNWRWKANQRRPRFGGGGLALVPTFPRQLCQVTCISPMVWVAVGSWTAIQQSEGVASVLELGGRGHDSAGVAIGRHFNGSFGGGRPVAAQQRA